MIVAKCKTMLAGRDEEAYAEFVVRQSRMRWCLSWGEGPLAKPGVCLVCSWLFLRLTFSATQQMQHLSSQEVDVLKIIRSCSRTGGGGGVCARQERDEGWGEQVQVVLGGLGSPVPQLGTGRPGSSRAAWAVSVAWSQPWTTVSRPRRPGRDGVPASCSGV